MENNLTDEEIVVLAEQEALPILKKMDELFKGHRASTIAVALAWSMAGFADTLKDCSTPIESVTQIMREALRVLEERGIDLESITEKSDESGGTHSRPQ